MDGILAAVEAIEFVRSLRFSRWAYAAANTAHIAAFAVLFGATLPLNLRLLGLWRDIPRAHITRVLCPVAAAGLTAAVVTGSLLFATRASEYAALDIMLVKLTLVAAGTVSALLAHARFGWTLDQASRSALALHAIISLGCWTGAIVCGRLIAFIAD